MGITVLHAADEDQAANIRADSREILADMLGMEGFIGATVGKIGRRMFTISAWDSPERTRQLLREGKHSVSMPPFFGGQRATSGFTSVWIPVRVNPYWVRCDACGRMGQAGDESTCACGEILPEHPAYW